MFASLKHSSTNQEQLLDVAHSQQDSAPELAAWLQHKKDLDETAQQAAAEQNMRHFTAAFNTSDGLSFSSKLLDSLIVQAFYHPLVYDTVSAMVSGHKHNLTDSDEDMAVGAAAGGRDRFRVELVLLELPPSCVRRTFGFVQICAMLQCGWVVLGLYRDQQAVSEFGRRTRQHARSVLQPGGTSDSGNTNSGERRAARDEVKEAASGRQPAGEANDVVRDAAAGAGGSGGGDSAALPADPRSLYYVLTNPPPDTVLQARDRLYALVQRWE